MKDKEIDTLLLCKLQNGKDYAIEVLAKEFKTDKATIHRSFMRLNKREGWSIRPYNMTPYRKVTASISGARRAFNMPLPERGRRKGERYDHHLAEPDWERTLYQVRRPD